MANAAPGGRLIGCRLRCLTTALAAALAFAAPAASQQVAGTVSDPSAGVPLPGTLVSLLDADSLVRATTVSDSAGRFLLRAPAGDSLRLRVQRLGYGTIESVPLLLDRADTLRLEIRMRAQPLALEGITATAEPRLRPRLRQFLQRKRIGFGRTLGPDELKDLPRHNTAVLLSSVPGSFLYPAAAGSIMARSRQGDLCQPEVYVDGLEVEAAGSQTIELGFGVPVSSYVQPELIMGVEVFRNPANAPFEYQYAFMPDCPVILIWTNHSFGIGD